jgi:hypothetical protein
MRQIFYGGAAILAILLGIQGLLTIRKINRQVIAVCQMIDSTITTMAECEVQRDSLKAKAKEAFAAEIDTLKARTDTFVARAGSTTARVGSTAVRIEGLVRRWADTTKTEAP